MLKKVVKNYLSALTTTGNLTNDTGSSKIGPDDVPNPDKGDAITAFGMHKGSGIIL